MSNEKGRASARQTKWKRDPEARLGRSASQPDAAEEALKDTEALIRSLIVEERRRVTPSLFPELEPADDDVETLEDAQEAKARRSLNQSVRDILQAERLTAVSRHARSRKSLLSRAFDALRRKSAEHDDMKSGE